MPTLVGVQTVEKQYPRAIRIATENTLERKLPLRLSNRDWAEKLVGLEGMVPLAQRGKRQGGLLLEVQPCVPTVYRFAHHLELPHEAVFQTVPSTDVRHFCPALPPLSHRSSPIAFRGLRLTP